MKSSLTKKARENLYGCNLGVGIIAIKSAPNEITEIEFYMGFRRDPRRVSDGEPIDLVQLVNWESEAE